MKATDMGVLWLRERALALRNSADKTEKAYSTPRMVAMTTRVAETYRRAAAQLEAEATAMEAGAKVTARTRDDRASGVSWRRTRSTG